MGTLNLISAAEKRNAKQFIFASTEWVYDSFQSGVQKTEESPIDAANLTSEYAFSKFTSEVNLRQKFKHGFCNTVILRFGIIYGPRKKNWSAVESLFSSVNSQKEIAIGSAKTGRHFIHVADIASGIIKSIGLTGFHLINLQGDSLITLGDIIHTAAQMLGKSPYVTEKDPENPSIREVSNSFAKAKLNWAPEYNLRRGLESVKPFI